jgi:hypothetical protein
MIYFVAQKSRAARGAAEVLPDGTGRYIACFPAGTMVHTAEGLLPIEKLRVGTLVLSQPEDGGEREMRPVVRKVSTLDQPLMAVQIHIQGDKGSELTTIVATPNHPFWVETPLVKGEDGEEPKHWLAAEYLEPCMTLQLADGRSAEVRSAAFIHRTQHEDIFFAGDERVDLAQVMCLKDGRLEVLAPERLAQLGKLDLGERYLAPVYNFEVEEFHTYYVGEVGVWVHNTNCQERAVNAALKKLELEAACFDGDTPVLHGHGSLVRIELLEVGSIVMSRCERTGQLATKRVLKVFENIAPTYAIFCNRGPRHKRDFGELDTHTCYATADHPFWITGKGWVPVRELQIGDELLTSDGDPTTVTEVATPEQLGMIFNRRPSQAIQTVYNIEVEDFNTYFIGTEQIWVHNCNNVNVGVRCRWFHLVPKRRE